MTTYISNAQWPKGTVGYQDDITTDKHDTQAQADAVCQLLNSQGFGGNGKIFPEATWVTSIDE